jgi:hypothetical protein
MYIFIVKQSIKGAFFLTGETNKIYRDSCGKSKARDKKVHASG